MIVNQSYLLGKEEDEKYFSTVEIKSLEMYVICNLFYIVPEDIFKRIPRSIFVTCVGNRIFVNIKLFKSRKNRDDLRMVLKYFFCVKRTLKSLFEMAEQTIIPEIRSDLNLSLFSLPLPIPILQILYNYYNDYDCRIGNKNVNYVLSMIPVHKYN